MTATLHALKTPGNGWRNAHKIEQDHDFEVMSILVEAHFKPNCKHRDGCIERSSCRQFGECLSP